MHGLFERSNSNGVGTRWLMVLEPKCKNNWNFFYGIGDIHYYHYCNLVFSPALAASLVVSFLMHLGVRIHRAVCDQLTSWLVPSCGTCLPSVRNYPKIGLDFRRLLPRLHQTYTEHEQYVIITLSCNQISFFFKHTTTSFDYFWNRILQYSTIIYPTI